MLWSHSAKQQTPSLLARVGWDDIRQKNLRESKMQRKKQTLKWQHTCWLALSEKVFQHFWAGINRTMKHCGWTTIVKIEGCNVRNLIYKGVLQTLPFTSIFTHTINTLLGKGLQDQNIKSIRSQIIFERYWTLYNYFCGNKPLNFVVLVCAASPKEN